MSHVSKYSTLEDLLEGHRQGAVESEGQFSLNPARARELLKQFQLPEPAQYILHLVSFLIGAGASVVAITGSRASLKIEAPGASIDEQALRSPFSVLLRSSAEPFRSELALGLNALLGMEKGSATLSHRGLKAVYSATEIRVEEKAHATDPVFVIKPRMAGSRELELIRESFRYSPTTVKIDGVTVSKVCGVKEPEGLEIVLKNEAYPLNLGQTTENRLLKDIAAPMSALIKIGRQDPSLRFVCLGRSFERPLPWSFLVPGWQVDITVNTDKLSKDLSQQNILEDQHYENMLLTLRNQCEIATKFLLTQVPPLSGTEDLVDDLVEHLAFEKRTEEALAFQRKLVYFYSLKTGSLFKARALYRLAMLETSLGIAPTASDLQFSLITLHDVRDKGEHEPFWSELRARMAFGVDLGETTSIIKDNISRPQVPKLMREQCLRWLNRQASIDPLSRARNRVGLARVLFDSGRPLQAFLELEQSTEFSRDSATEDGFRYRADELELRGEIAARLGQLPKSLEYFGQHLNLMREQHGQYSLKLGLTLERLSLILDRLGRTKQAAEYRAWSKRLYQET